MKLVTFTSGSQSPRVGALSGGDKVVDLKSAWDYLRTQNKAGLPSSACAEDMVAFIREQKQSLPAAESALQAAKENKLPASCVYPLNGVKLLSPVPRPTSLRDGYAFRQHVEAARRNRGLPMIPEFDSFPVFYFQNHLSVTGPGDLAVMPQAMEQLDFELEVAAVIGKEGRNLKPSEVDEHIFGYLVMNDWSARKLQMEEMKLSLGPAKGKDFSTSLGPFLVTKDELASHRIAGPNGERYALRMQAFVNDKQVSDGNFKDMTWTFGQIIERVSYGVTIYPGEVIGSGTVGTGCFLELNGSKITDNQWLKPGDRVALEVEGLGRLENTIRAAT